jgi:hypothetical protein
VVRAQRLAFTMSCYGDSLEQRILEMRERHRRDPVAFFAEVLEAIWMQSEPKDVEFLWQHRLRSAPWWAEDALWVFERVIADPPSNLCDLIASHAERSPVVDEQTGDQHEACVAWVRAQLEFLRSIHL